MWTVSTMAGVSRPRLERKIAPQRLTNNSKSGYAAARATVERKFKSDVVKIKSFNINGHKNSKN